MTSLLPPGSRNNSPGICPSSPQPGGQGRRRCCVPQKDFCDPCSGVDLEPGGSTSAAGLAPMRRCSAWQNGRHQDCAETHERLFVPQAPDARAVQTERVSRRPKVGVTRGRTLSARVKESSVTLAGLVCGRPHLPRPALHQR